MPPKDIKPDVAETTIDTHFRQMSLTGSWFILGKILAVLTFDSSDQEEFLVSESFGLMPEQQHLQSVNILARE